MEESARGAKTNGTEYGGLDGPKGQKSICVATTWLRQQQTLQHNPRAATPQPRTPPTVAEIMGIRKAQYTIKCRKPRKAIAATSCESDCHLLVEDDGLTELKVMEGCAELWALEAKLSVLEAASEGEKQCSGYRNGKSGS